MDVQPLLVKEIYADPEFNCRGQVVPFDVVELAKSIEQNGLAQPIVVQPYDNPPYKWRVVMGHRRLKAHEVLRRATIQASIRPDLTDIQARAMNLIENLERKDLTLMQEARALSKFKHLGQDEIAKMLGQSRGWVQVRAMALHLEPAIQAEIDAGFINQAQIREIYSIPSNEGKAAVVREIKDAKIRGEKRTYGPKSNVKKLTEKRVRTVPELYRMQDAIREAIGNNFATRCLAYAAGEISEMELYEDLKVEADNLGIPYSVPQIITPPE